PGEGGCPDLPTATRHEQLRAGTDQDASRPREVWGRLGRGEGVTVGVHCSKTPQQLLRVERSFSIDEERAGQDHLSQAPRPDALGRAGDRFRVVVGLGVWTKLD